MRHVRCILPLILLFASVSLAQLNRGSITGTITDATQAVVPNVKLSVQNTATGITYEGAANDSGQYTVPNLPPGSYTISFEAPSFKKLVRSGIDLSRWCQLIDDLWQVLSQEG